MRNGIAMFEKQRRPWTGARAAGPLGSVLRPRGTATTAAPGSGEGTTVILVRGAPNCAGRVPARASLLRSVRARLHEILEQGQTAHRGWRSVKQRASFTPSGRLARCAQGGREREGVCGEG